MTKKSAKDAAFNLDANIGEVNSQFDTLVGAKDLLFDIKELLDAAAFQGDTVIPISQIKGRLNAIHELIRYSLTDIQETHEELETNKEILFDYFVRNENVIT